jgi:hypothetical protein
VPGRAGRELVALEQYRIGDAELGQVLEGAAADCTTTDDDYPRMRLHVPRLSNGANSVSDSPAAAGG